MASVRHWWPQIHTTRAHNLLMRPGDTHAPFAKLGRSLNLPQTATLALRAPEQCINTYRHVEHG